MALSLVLASGGQSADLTTLIVSDNTGVYNSGTNSTGWGTPNTALADINGSTSHLTLGITLTEPDGSVITFDNIDFHTYHGTSPATVSDLVFTLTAAKLKVSGVALGLATDQLPDGYWEFTYTIDHNLVGGTGTAMNYTLALDVDGIIRKAVYDLAQSEPDVYNDINDLPTDDEQALIDKISYVRDLLVNKDLYPYPANKQKILNIELKIQQIIQSW